MQAITVFSLDPGPTQSAFIRCCFTGDNSLLGTPLVIEDMGTIGNNEMLERLARVTGAHLACEQVRCMGMPAGASVFDTVHWCGRFHQKAVERGLTMTFIPRVKIKHNICGSHQAKDANIRQALIDKYGEPGVKANPGMLYRVSSHLWSALAVGQTFYDFLMENNPLVQSTQNRLTDSVV